MKNVIVENIQNKLYQLQRAYAHQYERPESESEDIDMGIQEEAQASEDATEAGSD